MPASAGGRSACGPRSPAWGSRSGPVLGGLLLSRFWWGSVFLVNVPIVVVVLAISWWAVPESRNPGASQFDPLGVVLSVVGVSALVWATIQAPTEGWSSATTLRSFAIAIVLIGCLVLWELRCAHPMLELKFFRNPRFSVASVASGTANFAFAGSIFVLTQLLQFVFGYSPLSAGFALVPMAVSFMAAGLLGPAARRAHRLQTRGRARRWRSSRSGWSSSRWPGRTRDSASSSSRR